jgi:hypothetical protein
MPQKTLKQLEARWHRAAQKAADTGVRARVLMDCARSAWIEYETQRRLKTPEVRPSPQRHPQ